MIRIWNKKENALKENTQNMYKMYLRPWVIEITNPFSWISHKGASIEWLQLRLAIPEASPSPDLGFSVSERNIPWYVFYVYHRSIRHLLCNRFICSPDSLLLDYDRRILRFHVYQSDIILSWLFQLYCESLFFFFNIMSIILHLLYKSS